MSGSSSMIEGPDRRLARPFGSGLRVSVCRINQTRMASLNLNREMRRTKRLQEIPRVKDFAGSEYARRPAPHADDTLSRFHDKGGGDRVDISPFRNCPTLLSSHTHHYLNQDSLCL